MMSRRTSNMIFYGILVAILIVVVVARLIIVGAMNRKIEETDRSNILLQSQILQLEDAVQENKDISSDHLYELFDKVPEVYNETELIYFTEAQLELLGITDEFSVRRAIQPDEEVEFSNLSSFTGLQDRFKVVEVYVHFETTDLSVADDFIDALYSSEQIFVVSDIQFSNYTSGFLVGVDITFLAFYKHVEE